MNADDAILAEELAIEKKTHALHIATQDKQLAAEKSNVVAANVALLQTSIGAEYDGTCHSECGTGKCTAADSYSCTGCPAGRGLLVAQPRGTTLNPGTENRGQCKSFDDVQAKDGNCQVQCFERSYGYTIELGKSPSQVQSAGVMCSKVCRVTSAVILNSIKGDDTFANLNNAKSHAHCDLTKIGDTLVCKLLHTCIT